MIRRAAIAIVLACSAAVASCSSDSYTQAEGGEGGPCYLNGTCDVELTCKSNRCVRLVDDGGAAADGGADAATDGALSADSSDSCAPPQLPPVQCELPGGAMKTCASNEVCCVDDSACLDDSANCTAADGTLHFLECFGAAHCAPGEKCCLVATRVGTSTCPATLDQFQWTRCAVSCTTTELELCSSGSADACKGRCEPAKLVVDYLSDGKMPKDFIVGLCL